MSLKLNPAVEAVTKVITPAKPATITVELSLDSAYLLAMMLGMSGVPEAERGKGPVQRGLLALREDLTDIESTLIQAGHKRKVMFERAVGPALVGLGIVNLY